MMWLFFAVEEEEDRDVERRKNPYLSQKGFRWMLLGFSLAVLGALAYIKLVWEPARWPLHIKGDLRAIHAALFLYAEQNDDGLPMAYITTAGDVPLADSQGRPAVWASNLADYISSVEHFTSPAIPKEWGTPFAYRDRQTDELKGATLSYGILSWMTLPPTRTYLLEDTQVMVAESISSGNGGSYNPRPVPGGLPDGFLIGYNDSNFQPTAESKFVTRLALVGTGKDPTALQPVHPGGVLVLFPDGRVASLPPAEAEIPRGTLKSRWR
ncbi:MAG: hypothetical protein AB1725_00555 [Armatimonadota bacterium]